MTSLDTGRLLDPLSEDSSPQAGFQTQTIVTLQTPASTNIQSGGYSLPLPLPPSSRLRYHNRKNTWNTPGSISQNASNISVISVSKITDVTGNILLSKLDAFINICKCFTGASLFAIPWAFKQSGMLSGAVSLLLLAFMTYYTLYWLAQCGHLHPYIPAPTYPDIAFFAFGKVGFYVAWVAILCMTCGVCSSYLVFIGSQLSLFFHSNMLNQDTIIFIVAIPMVSLSFLRSYHFLVPFNIIGLISLILAVIIVIYEASKTLHTSKDDFERKYYYNSIGDYPLFLGNAAFAFLIHSVILPIEESMSDRTQSIAISKDYVKALNYAIVFVTILFLFFAEFVYYAFGDSVCGNIMDNLDENKWYTKLVIMSLCINLFFTYPLFLFPMIECLEFSLFNLNESYANNSNRWIEMKRNILRIFLVLITCAIAVCVPDFEKLTGLTGAFGNNVLGLILPPIMYFRLVTLHNRKNPNDRVEIKCFDKLIGYASTLVGVVMLILCTVIYVYSIIFDSKSECT